MRLLLLSPKRLDLSRQGALREIGDRVTLHPLNDVL